MEFALLLVPFITSAVMFGAKALAGLYMIDNGPSKKAWLRGILILVSLGGVIASSILTGNPIDPNAVSDMVKALVETGLTAYFAHAFYNSAFRR